MVLSRRLNLDGEEGGFKSEISSSLSYSSGSFCLNDDYRSGGIGIVGIEYSFGNIAPALDVGVLVDCLYPFPRTIKNVLGRNKTLSEFESSLPEGETPLILDSN